MLTPEVQPTCLAAVVSYQALELCELSLAKEYSLVRVVSIRTAFISKNKINLFQISCMAQVVVAILLQMDLMVRQVQAVFLALLQIEAHQATLTSLNLALEALEGQWAVLQAAEACLD